MCSQITLHCHFFKTAYRVCICILQGNTGNSFLDFSIIEPRRPFSHFSVRIDVSILPNDGEKNRGHRECIVSCRESVRSTIRPASNRVVSRVIFGFSFNSTVMARNVAAEDKALNRVSSSQGNMARVFNAAVVASRSSVNYLRHTMLSTKSCRFSYDVYMCTYAFTLALAG